MVSKGNKAVLVNSDFCQNCGKCCKEFTLGNFDLDCSLRFLWMNNIRIRPRDSPFRDCNGSIMRDAVFDFPCKKLIMDSGKYSCGVYDSDRPDFCNTYPDNQFYSIDTWDVDKIKKMLEYASIDCPGLKLVSVEQVQKMLNKMREEE